MTPVFGEIVGWEALLVLLIIVLLFGSSKLPSLARSIGEASRELRKGMSDDGNGEQKPERPAESAGGIDRVEPGDVGAAGHSGGGQLENGVHEVHHDDPPAAQKSSG